MDLLTAPRRPLVLSQFEGLRNPAAGKWRPPEFEVGRGNVLTADDLAVEITEPLEAVVCFLETIQRFLVTPFVRGDVCA